MATILIVDDEPTVLSLCQAILKRGGYEVLAASGGTAALSLLENNNNQIELALLDVIMPGMNGIELARRIQVTHPDTKILLMTGFDPNEIAQVVGGSNPYRITWKPFKTDSLLQMIENMLDGSDNLTVSTTA
jgi:DNA-binding NtrC family response regulator